MQYIITIDGGTTNTRCVLWDEKRNKISEESRQVGVRNTSIDGNNKKLKTTVKECLDKLLTKNDLQYRQINRIIASGMITSEVGIVEIPHLKAPVGLDELAASLIPKQLNEICPIPIYFIPGIKNDVPKVELSNFESMDIMRGEEVESIAVIDKFFKGNPMLLIFPGSHNKFVLIDSAGKISGCLTSISGELLASITNDTILAKSVGHKFVNESEYDRVWLLTGYLNAKKVGLGRACFSGRILHLFNEDDTNKIANYILGATLQGDIQAIKNSEAIKTDDTTDVIVSGKNPIRQALIDILEYEGGFGKIKGFIPDEGISLSATGAYLIAKCSNIL